MSEPVNPYAPPQASLEPAGAEDCWRSGAELVMRQGGSLPPRCVKCNAPAEPPIKARRVYWHHPALYLLVLFPGPIIYAIVGLIFRKQSLVPAGLCAEHRRKRNTGLAVGWLGALLGLALMIAGPANDSCGLAVAGLLLFLGTIIAGMVMARIVYPTSIDGTYARLKGCGEAFLAGLPEFNG